MRACPPLLLLLLLTCCLAQPAVVLWLLDCGSHGQKMRDIILREGFSGQLRQLDVRLTTCEYNASMTTEQAYRLVLDSMKNDTTTFADEHRLSLSFGSLTGVPSATLRDILAIGGRIWAAAGNDGNANGCYYPAAQEGVLAVDATDSYGNLQFLSDGCALKPPDQVLRVSSCWTSDATAIASARGLETNFTRAVPCIPGWLIKYQWQYMYTTITSLILFLAGLLAYYIVQRIRGRPPFWCFSSSSSS